MDPLQIIAEPRRQAILQTVWDRECSAGEIASRFEITFGAVSQHLRILHDAGFVDLRREGNFRYYRANKANLGPLRAYLEQLWTGHLNALKRVAEDEDRTTRSLRRRSHRRH